VQIGVKKTIYFLSALFLLWLTLRFLLPLFSPFLLGALLALAAEPMVAFLSSRLHLPRWAGTGVGITAAFLLLCALLLALGGLLLREIRALSAVIPELEQTIQSGSLLLQGWLLSLVSRIPGNARILLQESITVFFSNSAVLFQQAVRWLLGIAGGLLSHLPDSALTLGTTVVSGYMISAKLQRIRFWLRAHISRERLNTLLAALQRVKTVLKRWLLAQTKLMGMTFCILLSGFFLLRIPSALYWAVGTALVDAFPVLGTGTVLLPWSLLSYLRGDIPRAVGLLGIYITVSLIRSALEPKLLGSHLGLDPLVTLICLYVGFQLWGLGGMLLTPLVLVTVFQILPQHRRS